MKKVTLYTLSTCPWCHKARKFFALRNVSVNNTDYDLADQATQAKIMKELDAVGATGFPYARIGDQVILGYQPERYAQALKS